MKTMSKADQDEQIKLYATARRYEKSAYRAATWWRNTGTAMFVPGELTRLLRESKAAQRELDAMAPIRSVLDDSRY